MPAAHDPHKSSNSWQAIAHADTCLALIYQRMRPTCTAVTHALLLSTAWSVRMQLVLLPTLSVLIRLCEGVVGDGAGLAVGGAASTMHLRCDPAVYADGPPNTRGLHQGRVRRKTGRSGLAPHCAGAIADVQGVLVVHACGKLQAAARRAWCVKCLISILRPSMHARSYDLRTMRPSSPALLAAWRALLPSRACVDTMCTAATPTWSWPCPTRGPPPTQPSRIRQTFVFFEHHGKD